MDTVGNSAASLCDMPFGPPQPAGLPAAFDQLSVARLAPASGRPARQLVILCHGHGGNGQSQLKRAGRLALGLRDAAFACPHGPMPANGDPAKRRWFVTSDVSAE